MIKYQLLVIGGSAGSIEVLLQILPDVHLRPDLAIVIVVHRKNTNDSILPELLSSKTTWAVKDAEEKEKIKPGIIYLAPSDYHLLIEKDHTFSLDVSEKVNYSRPSIDVSFESAAEIFGVQLTCLLLSGASSDGVDGLKAVKKCMGETAIQDPEMAEISYMPQQALLHAPVDHILRNEKIAAFINNL